MSKEEDPPSQREDADEDLRAAAEDARETSEAFRQSQEIVERAKAYRENPPKVSDELVKQMVDAARSRLPRVLELLQKGGQSGSRLDAQMIKLNAMPFEEDVILRLLGDGGIPEDDTALVETGIRSPVRRRLEIVKHSIIRWWNKKSLFSRLVYLGSWFAALLGPSIQKGWTWSGIIGIAIVIGMRVRSHWKDLDREDLPVLESNQRRRQLQLERLIEKMQRWVGRAPSLEERSDFHRDVLELIAQYVRDHRSDSRGTMIYANLLVRRRGAVMVISRSDLLRKVPEIYTAEECSLAWKTMETGAPQYTGDVYAHAPKTRKGKTYSSILVLPIKSGTEVLGVVSIDSESKYHFDSVVAALHGDLAPYVQLLAITLTKDHDTSGQRELTDGEQHGSNTGDPRPGA